MRFLIQILTMQILIAGSLCSTSYGMNVDSSKKQANALSQAVTDMQDHAIFIAAISTGNTDVVRAWIASLPAEKRDMFLMMRDVHYNTALHCCLANGNLILARLLIESVSIKRRAECIMAKDLGGRTVFHLLAMYNNPSFAEHDYLELAQVFLEALPAERKAAFVATKTDGITALQIAKVNYHPELACMLEKVAPEPFCCLM